MHPRLPRLFVLLSLISATVEPVAAEERRDPCPDRGTELVVDAKARTLHLCLRGRRDAVFPVNLGQGGLGKRRQGDQKTPVGRYRLSPPRPSVSGFTWFVPIQYPTAAQKKLGYSGGAIGIHGPPDWMPSQVIDLAFSTPWTDGCIMVRTKAEIDWIRGWLLEHEPTSIEILAHAQP